MRTDKIHLFWLSEEEEKFVPISDQVSIHKMETRPRSNETYVTLRASIEAKDFIKNHRSGKIIAQHNPIPYDNPHSGLRLFTISHMSLVESWIDNVTYMKKSDQQFYDAYLEMFIKNRCLIHWHILE